MSWQRPVRCKCRVKHERSIEILTMAQLAELVGISVSMLAEIEAGRSIPNVITALKIAHVFGVRPEYLWPGA